MDWTDDTEDDWADFEAAPTVEQSTSAIELNNTSENAALAINHPAESFDEAHESQFLDHKDVTTDYQQREAVEGNVCEFVASNNTKEEEEIRRENEKEIETDTNTEREIQRAEEVKVFEPEEKPKEIETETETVKEEEVKVSEPKDMTKEIEAETETVKVEEVKVSEEEEKPKEIETEAETVKVEEVKVFEEEEKPKEIEAETETERVEEVKVSEEEEKPKEIETETETVKVEEVKVSEEEEKPKEIETETETVKVEEVKVSEPKDMTKEIEAETETVKVEEVKVFEEEEKPKEIEAETETALIKVFEEEEKPKKIEAEAETVKVEEVKVSEEVLFESAPTFSASDVDYLTISESIPSSTNALNNNDDQFPYEVTSNSATFDFSPNIGDQDNEHAIKEESVGLAEEEREQKSSNIQEDDWDDFVDPSVPVPAEEPMKEQESRENAIDAVGESGNNDNDEEWEDFIDPSSPVNQESLNVSSFPEVAIVSYDTENKANETQEETFGAEDEDEDWDAFEAAPVTTLTQQTTNEGDRKNEDLFSNNAIVDKPEDSFGDEDDWNAFEGPAATSAPTNVITRPAVTQPPAFTAQFEEKKEESFGFEADFGDFNSFEGGKDTQASSFFEESEPKRSQRDAFSDANETREFDLSGIEGVDAFKTLLGDSSLKREVVSAYLPLANLSYKIFDSSPIAVSAQDTTGVKECLENASSDILHPWGDSLSSFQAERKGQYYYLHNDLGAGTPTSSHRWFCKEVKKILLENIPSDALPTDQMKSTIQKSFSITQDFVQPAQPTQTTQPAPSLNLPKISKVNNAPAVERVTESSAAPTVVLEDPKGKRPPAQSSVGSKSIEQNKPEITPTSRSSEAVKAEVKKEGEIGATLRIGLNQDELSPAAFNYLKNLPDFSFLLQVND